jgi:hypothetical protein
MHDDDEEAKKSSSGSSSQLWIVPLLAFNTLPSIATLSSSTAAKRQQYNSNSNILSGGLIRISFIYVISNNSN